ncbi:MAG: magnesium protoporphyrin IX methyltransferase [Pseudomonadota bacterium]
MTNATYETRRGELKTYFDRTAKDNWVALTSNTPVSRIRQTVRQGREEMRRTLVDWLPLDLSGARILDAGCGTGMLAIEAANRGAEVVAVDISPTLIEEAKNRTRNLPVRDQITFEAGDMADPAFGYFDFVVAMDSLIHYPIKSVIPVIEGLSSRARQRVAFTFAPKTPALAAMKSIGRFFPKSDRSPSIEPISEANLRSAIEASMITNFGFQIARTKRVSTGFYKSQAMEIVNI